MSGLASSMRSHCATSRLSVSSSMSTNTGTNPTCNVGLSVVGKPAMGINTRVPLGKLCPRLEVSAAIISKLLLLPELVTIPFFLPNCSGNLCSKRNALSPITNQPLSKLSTPAMYSAES